MDGTEETQNDILGPSALIIAQHLNCWRWNGSNQNATGCKCIQRDYNQQLCFAQNKIDDLGNNTGRLKTVTTASHMPLSYIVLQNCFIVPKMSQVSELKCVPTCTHHLISYFQTFIFFVGKGESALRWNNENCGLILKWYRNLIAMRIPFVPAAVHTRWWRWWSCRE
jgi:hypothetical protein